jgi:simple sugar transport system permease protein
MSVADRLHGEQKTVGRALLVLFAVTVVGAVLVRGRVLVALASVLLYAELALVIGVYRPGFFTRVRTGLILTGFGILVVGVLLEAFFPTSPMQAVFAILSVGMAEAAVRISVPIALAAIGGLYSEKSGVFNIGLEGFLIFGAFSAIATAFLVGGGTDVSQVDLWIGLLVAAVVTTLLAGVFAVITIRYKANQIVAGLAVWFVALGFAPFAASVIWDNINSPSIGTLEDYAIPLLSEIPLVGDVIFEANPIVLFTLAIVALTWYVLYFTKYGYWVQAAGENPEALATAGVSVNRVRYGSVLLSGSLCGLGGAMLSIGVAAQFIGQGVTMVNGRGWIAITAYLFGNYNPFSTFLAALLFGGVDAFQIRLQNLGFGIPSNLIELFPFVAVLVVLLFVSGTRMPSAAGEPFETEEN